MDKAPASGAGDSGFESPVRLFFFNSSLKSSPPPFIVGWRCAAGVSNWSAPSRSAPRGSDEAAKGKEDDEEAKEEEEEEVEEAQGRRPSPPPLLLLL